MSVIFLLRSWLFEKQNSTIFCSNVHENFFFKYNSLDEPATELSAGNSIHACKCKHSCSLENDFQRESEADLRRQIQLITPFSKHIFTKLQTITEYDIITAV